MTTPAVVYRHKAMSSLRARATTVVLRIRPPRRRTRSWNQRLSAEAGWFCSHSQASSTMLALADQFRSYDGPGETESPPATAGLFATELLLNRASSLGT